MADCQTCAKPTIGESKFCNKCLILGIVLKQASALGLPWREVCAPVMEVQNITVEQVEERLRYQINKCTLEITAGNDKAANYRMRAILYCQVGDLERAWEDATCEISPDAQETWRYLVKGVVHYHRGQYQDALVEYDKALAIQPDSKWAQSLRDGARERLGTPNG